MICNETPVTDASSNLTISAGSVGMLRVGAVLDVANKATENFGSLRVASAINRHNADGGAHQTNVARNLSNVGRNLVDGERRTEVLLTLVLVTRIPLLTDA